MNIFVLHEDPKIAALEHCDKHIVKMILEYAQLLSSAHRFLDGVKTTITKPNGRKGSYWLLPSEDLSVQGKDVVVVNTKCYNATHWSHPCAVWARTNSSNYLWLLQLLKESLAQYTVRYKKQHTTQRIVPFLSNLPANLPVGVQTPFAIAMPVEYKVPDAVQSYKNYYIGDKVRFARWTNVPTPTWFLDHFQGQYAASHFERTR